MQEPLVSVIITTYKRSDLLGKAIDSVLNQNYNNLEIIVVDDNNPESEFRVKTQKKMQQYQVNPKVVYIQHTENKNGAAARNTGLKNANGKYVTYLDDDDTYRKDKIKKEVIFLENHLNYQAVYCGWFKDGKNYSPTAYGDLSIGVLSGETPIITNSIMMSKNKSIEIGGWDESFRRNQEAAFMLNYFKSGEKIGVIPDILIDFDMSDRGNASNPQKSEEDMTYFLNTYKKYFHEITRGNKVLKKEVLTKRGISTMLLYIKNNFYGDAMRVFFKLLIKYPISFIKEIIIILTKRINKEL